MKQVLRLFFLGIYCTAIPSLILADSDHSNPQGVVVLPNGDFEAKGEGWNLWGAEVSRSARKEGRYGLRIQNDHHKWSGADQILPLPANTHKVVVNGWMKTTQVNMGKEPWEMARISIEFLDASQQLTGGYPPVTGETNKPTDWTFYEYTYRPHDGARFIKVMAALANASGEALYDNLSVSFFDQQGNALQVNAMSGPMDWGEWYQYPAASASDHYVDWSSLLHTPAGKHGFLTVRGDSLYFEDGTPARFWGTNLVAPNMFASHKDIDAFAERLSKMGSNIVRLHHMDAPWSKPNIFGNTRGTRQLDPTSLEKLDYLIASLKQKGIYVFLDLLVHREFSSKDGVKAPLPDLGGKQVGFFDPTVIELQKEYIEQLLTHKNQ